MVDRRTESMGRRRLPSRRPPRHRPPAPMTAARVASYLRSHPDFLVRHPDLVTVLTPPAAERGETVVDMQQFMLKRLQDEVRQIRRNSATS